MRKLKYLLLILMLVPLMFAQYEIPIENLLTNSGFGVWSQSDAAKGIAVLNYDGGTDVGGGDTPDVGDAVTGATSTATGKIVSMTITAGTFPGDNAAGAITLGAVTGTFQDNETINFTDLESALVNGDAGVGIKNDPMNNDSTGDWLDDGANITLADNVGEYTVTTAAINQRAWLGANASVTIGKIYIIELEIKDGGVAGKQIQGYFDDGAAQYGAPVYVTAVGWGFVSWTFECATTTATGKVGFRVPENLAGNIEIRRFSCYEITPGCTVGNAKTFDGWFKDGDLDLFRQHNDGGTYTKDGSFYSLKIVPGIPDQYLYFPNFASLATNEEWYRQFAGRTITIGFWAKTSTADHCKPWIYDGVVRLGSAHTGGGSWEWLEYTHTLATGITVLSVGIMNNQASNIDGTTIIYISQPMLSFQSSIGSGNYSPRQHEWVYFESFISSNTLDNLQNQSDIAFATLNIEADSNAMLPKGCKAIEIISEVRDSGSAAASTAGRFLLQRDPFVTYGYYNVVSGLGNNARGRIKGQQECNSDGDVDYYVDATGVGTFDIILFKYIAVQVTD